MASARSMMRQEIDLSNKLEITSQARLYARSRRENWKITLTTRS